MKKTVSVAPMMDCTDKHEIYFLSLISKNINLYKGQVSKSGVAILPSKRTRRTPEVKKASLADEALSELKAEQPEIKEENLDTEEAPLELSEEVPAEENKSE